MLRRDPPPTQLPGAVFFGASPMHVARRGTLRDGSVVDLCDAGLVPIIEPEVNIHSDSKAECETILKAELEKHLSALPENEIVMLKLTLPEVSGHYASLADHPNVLRVVALSGGYSTDDACRELAKNPGMIASFSRGLLQDLRAAQDDAEFDATLSAAMDKIQAASVA